MVTYTGKLYINTIQNKGSQVIDSPASTLENLRYREIDMYTVTINTKLKV